MKILERAVRDASSSPANPGLIQRKCERCKKKQLLQRSAFMPPPISVPSAVHNVLSTPGRQLDTATRGFMEPRLGHDFSRVRVHSGEKAARSAREVGALAYTAGSDIVFGENQFQPESPEGRRLIAHELVHVVQQKGLEKPLMPELAMGPSEDTCEREADRLSDLVSGDAAPVHPASSQIGPITTGRANGAAVRQRSSSPAVQRKVPTGIAIKELKPFGHSDLKSDELKKKYLTSIGTVSLMQLLPAGDYSEEQKRGECTKEFLTEVSNTCPPFNFCGSSRCLEVNRFGTAGDASTGRMVTDGPDTFIDRHINHMPTSFLSGSGKDRCSVVCHQRYKYRTEPDRKYHDVGSFYIIRNFSSGKYKDPGSKSEINITTGRIDKVPAQMEAPSKEKFARDIAPGLVKGGSLLEAPPDKKDKEK